MLRQGLTTHPGFMLFENFDHILINMCNVFNVMLLACFVLYVLFTDLLQDELLKPDSIFEWDFPLFSMKANV